MNELVERLNPSLEIAKAENDLQPCEREYAKIQARILFGCYPRAKTDDPKIYTRMVVSLFESYPADVVQKAVDAVTRKSKYLPNRAVIYHALEEAVSPLKRNLTDAHRRKRDLQIIEENKAEKERRAKLEEEKDAFNKKFYAEHGCMPFDYLRRQLSETALATESEKNEKISN